MINSRRTRSGNGYAAIQLRAGFGWLVLVVGDEDALWCDALFEASYAGERGVGFVCVRSRNQFLDILKKKMISGDVGEKRCKLRIAIIRSYTLTAFPR